MRAVHETSRARAALDAYLALGPNRSLEKLRQSFAGPSVSLRWLQAWSASFDWQQRAVAYDAEQLATERAERDAAAAEERGRRRAKRLADLDALSEIADTARALMKAMEILRDPTDVLKFYEFVHKNERLEMGEATDRQEMGGEQVVRVIYDDNAGPGAADGALAPPPSEPEAFDCAEPPVQRGEHGEALG
jgi:hypothetical protein